MKKERWNCDEKSCVGYCHTCVNSVEVLREKKDKKMKSRENSLENLLELLDKYREDLPAALQECMIKIGGEIVYGW